MFPAKLPLLRGSSLPRNTLFLGPSQLIIQYAISIGSAVFVWVSNAMLYNAFSVEKKTPQNCPFLLRFRHPAGEGPSHGHMQHAQNLVKIAPVVPEISSRTDRHTDVLIAILRNCYRVRSN